jgi:hypothetical protein
VADHLKEWVKAWKSAAKDLAAVRSDDIRRARTAEAIKALASNFRWFVRQSPPKPGSGLVELQEYFSRLRG